MREYALAIGRENVVARCHTRRYTRYSICLIRVGMHDFIRDLFLKAADTTDQERWSLGWPNNGGPVVDTLDRPLGTSGREELLDDQGS